MDHGQYEHVLAFALADDAIGIRQQLADVVIAKIRHDSPDPGQAVENFGLVDEVLERPYWRSGGSRRQ